MVKPSAIYENAAREILDHLRLNNIIEFFDSNIYGDLVEVLSYFLYYGYLPFKIPDKSSYNEKFNVALKCLASAPWMGAAGEKYRKPMEILLNCKVLTFEGHLKLDKINLIRLNCNICHKAFGIEKK